MTDSGRKISHVAILAETSLMAGRDILSGVADYVRSHEQWSIFTYPHDIDRPPPAWFREFHCDGIIIRLHDERIAQAVREKNVPVVDVLGIYDQGRYPLVHTDNVAIGQLAADHFRERGFVHFGYVGIHDEYWSCERQKAFVSRVEEFGGHCSALTWSNDFESNNDVQTQMKLITDWMRKQPLPLAIFVCSDPRTLILRNALSLGGYVIGRDVAILGVGNDVALCDMPTPSLSSIDANHRQVGYEAAALLDSMMKGNAAPSEPLLIKPLDVVVRESTDFMAVPDKELQMAVNFIRQNATAGLSVDDVVQACCVSRSVLQRRFMKYLGQTVHDSILQEKTMRAIKMIRYTNESIEHIATATGFQYVQSLNKALRRLYGHSACDYRRGVTGEVTRFQDKRSR